MNNNIINLNFNQKIADVVKKHLLFLLAAAPHVSRSSILELGGIGTGLA